MLYRYHCIRRDGYNYTVSPYFIALPMERGINIVAIWKIKKFNTKPAPEISLETSARDMLTFQQNKR